MLRVSDAPRRALPPHPSVEIWLTIYFVATSTDQKTAPTVTEEESEYLVLHFAYLRELADN